jgi:hypothetical protein
MRIPALAPDELSRLTAYMKTRLNYLERNPMPDSPWKRQEPLSDCIETLKKGDSIPYHDFITGEDWEVRNDSGTVYMIRVFKEDNAIPK